MTQAVDLSKLIGLEAGEARRRLELAGEPVGAVVETMPRPPAVQEGPLRVIRARRGGDGRVELIVTRERFVPQYGRG